MKSSYNKKLINIYIKYRRQDGTGIEYFKFIDNKKHVIIERLEKIKIL